MIDESTRGRDDEVRLLRESDGLSHQVDAADDAGASRTDRGAESHRDVVDLDGEFARRGENETVQRLRVL